MTRRIALGSLASLVLVSLLGCSTDVQLINRHQKAREEGVQLYNQGSYAEAAGAFRNAIRQDGRDYRAHFYLGASYEQLKQYDSAIKSYKSALDVIKVSIEGRENTAFRARIIDTLASLIARVDEHGLQRQALEADARTKQSGELYFVLAKVHRAAGDPDSALDAYNRALLMATKDFDIAKDYGLYAVQIGQTQQAEKPLRRAYTLNPRDAQVVSALRQIGIVPGPEVPEKDLVTPTTPGMEIKLPTATGGPMD